MERTINESNTSKAAKPQKGSDWQTIVAQIATYALQGACMTLGGMAASSAANVFIEPRRESVPPERHLPTKKSAN